MSLGLAILVFFGSPFFCLAIVVLAQRLSLTISLLLENALS